MKVAEQLRIPAASGSPPSLQLFGGINVRDGSVAYTFAAARNSEGFIAWLEHLMVTVYPQQAVCLVLDNARFHKSRAALAALSLYAPRLQVFWLPVHAPELNPIERYWRYLKRFALANLLYRNMTAMRLALERQLAVQNQVERTGRFNPFH
jgi:transposase